MATTDNLLIASLRGSIGKQIVFRKYRHKTVVSAFPNMNRIKWSPKQLEVQERMRQASDYAVKIMSEEVTRNAALIRLNVLRGQLRSSLISEFYANLKKGTVS